MAGLFSKWKKKPAQPVCAAVVVAAGSARRMEGIDKILKKCGEECAETIIAAKNTNREDLKNEVCDLLYHLLVMLAEKEIEIDEVLEILEQRRQKIGNLKQFKTVDRNS